MKFATFFVVVTLCFTLLNQVQSTLIIKPLFQGSEDQGEGITDQEVSFIKARII